MPGLPVLRSRDLVNWTFVSYALDRLDLAPSFRPEEGRSEYGRGIWAPCFRFHDGTTVTLDASGLRPGDVAGLALFNRPYAWLGVERSDDGLALAQFDEVTGTTSRAQLKNPRVWLRANCDFVTNTARFHYSTDGATYAAIGEPHVMAYGLVTFQGVRNSLFSYDTRSGAGGGHADFDAVEVAEQPRPPIPNGKRIEISVQGGTAPLVLDTARAFRVEDRGLGRVALESDGRYVSVGRDQVASLRHGAPGEAETFQWMETFDGDLILMSQTRPARLPKATDAEQFARREAIQTAMRGAIDVPLDMTRACREALGAAVVVASCGIASATRDVIVGIELLGAALRGAGTCVDENVSAMTDAGYVDAVMRERRQLEADADDAVKRIRSILGL